VLTAQNFSVPILQNANSHERLSCYSTTGNFGVDPQISSDLGAYSTRQLIGPIPWGHSGPLVTRCRCRRCRRVVVVGVVDIDAQAACDSTVATPGELA